MIDALQGMKPRFLCFSRICKTGMKERKKVEQEKSKASFKSSQELIIDQSATSHDFISNIPPAIRPIKHVI
jgi:hypothetical protein